MRIILSAILLTLTLTLTAQSPAAKFAAAAATDSAQCAVLVIDLTDGKVVDSHNADMPLIPASVTKAVTIASLLEKSGTNYCYHTKIYTQGKINNGVLEGNLLVEGGGDPSLGATREPIGTDILAECVSALKKTGITTIEGEINIDSSIFPLPATPPTWAEADKRCSYGTGCFGVNYAHNSAGKASVSNPPAIFQSRLNNAIVAAGIEIKGVSIKDAGAKRLLLDHRSPPIEDIMRSCMMRSDNMYAEAFLRTYALLNKKTPTSADGAALEMQYWKHRKLPMQGVTLVDGSGLSRANRMTTRFLADVLVKMCDNVEYVSFFPLAGQEGTLRNFLKDTPLDSYIAMKTGSMTGVQCYAGYKLDDDFAPTHVVVIMINSFHGTRTAVKAAAQNMLLELFNTK